MILIPATVLEPREFWARFIHVFVNILTLISGYIFLKKVRGQRTALAFAVFFGTSIFVIWWSQIAMYLNLAICAGVFMTIALANFAAKPKSKNLSYLAIAAVFGLLIFPDFIFYTPALLWVVWDRRDSLKLKDLLVPTAIFLIPIVFFYIPWIIYAFLGNAPNAGFNYIIRNKIARHADVVKNLKGYWVSVFGQNGVIGAWPFALISFFHLKRIKYAKYLFLTVLIYLVVFIGKSPQVFFYFVSILGPLFIIAADTLAIYKKYTYKILFIIALVNIVTVVPLFRGVHNPFMLGEGGKQLDHVKEAGELAKRCLAGEKETYISSFDAWKTAYYFGKRSLLERDGSEARIATIGLFLNGEAPEVKLIHYREGEVDKQIEGKLDRRAEGVILLGNEKAFLFKKCG